MFSRFKSKCSTTLGIDLCPTSIKLFELSLARDQYTIEGYGIEPLPEGAMEGYSITDIDGIANTIKKALITAKLCSKTAILAVPDALTMNNIIQVPNCLQAQEIEQWVRGEADKHISYPMNDIHLDFKVLGPSSTNDTLLNVLMVVAKAQDVSDRAEVAKRAGLDVRIIDVESYAIERAQAFFPLLQPQPVVSTNTSHPFMPANVAKKVICECLSQDASRLLVACGLALRHAETSYVWH